MIPGELIPSTVVGLLVLGVAVIPGLVYTLMFERQVSGFGVTFADRTLRFVAVSVIFHLVAAWLEYWLYQTTLAEGGPIRAGDFALLWLGAILLVVLPAIAGTIIGGLYRTRTTRSGWGLIRARLSEERERQLLRAVLGPGPAPRAWDDFLLGAADHLHASPHNRRKPLGWSVREPLCVRLTHRAEQCATHRPLAPGSVLRVAGRWSLAGSAAARRTPSAACPRTARQ